MTTNPKVSVIIPTYNRATMVTEAVASALAQSWDNLEVVVVDDGSTDDTLALLQAMQREDPRLRIVEGPHLGASNARNLGVQHAQGDYFAFLDSDDLFEPHKLATCMAVFAAQPDLVLVHSWWTQHTLATGDLFVHKPVAQGDARHLLLTFTQIATPTVVVSRAGFDGAGGFRKGMFLVEDYDLWCRISAFGPIGLITEPLVEVRLHGNNSERNPATIRDNQLAVINGYFDGFDTEGLQPRSYYIANSYIAVSFHHMERREYLQVIRYCIKAMILDWKNNRDRGRYVIRDAWQRFRRRRKSDA